MTFADAVVAWQTLHGRHSLPWQHQGPYQTWVSEVMLQQTQVATVIPYFNRFMGHYPTVEDLADAHIDDVLALWSGLGYYRRAHHLHQAARLWRDRYLPSPQTLEEWMSLPGVGRSTAGAVLSLALGQPYPIFDGNVRRVFSRYLGPDFLSLSQKDQWQSLASYVPKEHPGRYNQGLMDLGSGVCLKQLPLCDVCPLNEACQRYMEPSGTRRAPAKVRVMRVAYLEKEGKIALVQRGKDDIWPSLWFFPEALEPIFPMYQSSHRLTHQHLQILVYEEQDAREDVVWFGEDELKCLARPAILEPMVGALRALS